MTAPIGHKAGRWQFQMVRGPNGGRVLAQACDGLAVCQIAAALGSAEC